MFFEDFTSRGVGEAEMKDDVSLKDPATNLLQNIHLPFACFSLDATPH
jgi:hypothetical protein